MTDTNLFYTDIEASESFRDAADERHHAPLPADWTVVVADVLGSTKAIEQGRYKQVNTIGGSVIAAVVNVDRTIDIPYVFGGDGALMAVPPAMIEGTKAALLGTRTLAREAFDLDLRIGLIQASYLNQQGHVTRIGKMRTSKDIIQAALSGDGWGHAESLVKDPATREQFEIREQPGIDNFADFSGFECRWQGIPSRRDHKICLLVECFGTSTDSVFAGYEKVLERVTDIYGTEAEHHPIRIEELKLALNPRQLLGESLVRTNRTFINILRYIGTVLFQNLAGVLLFRFKIDTKAVAWSRYREDLIANSDYRKFDGILKMVMDGSTEQQTRLTQYLEKAYTDGRLAYGIHTAPEALMTCLIFSYNGQHAHFVDGSNGGYAMAAKDFKKRVLKLRESELQQSAPAMT